MITSSYRPRNPGHDYHDNGTYLITLVVSQRLPLLARLGNDVKSPEVELTALGKMMQHTWNAIPEKQKAHGNEVAVHACVCMPEHFHGVIEVLKPMQWSLGDIIQAFSFWQEQHGYDHSSNRPITVDCYTAQAPTWLREKARGLARSRPVQTASPEY